MREYGTAHGFRAAVDAHLRAHARQLGVATYIVRRQAALERLLVRLGEAAPNRWAIKGGLALDTRLGARARASLDLDVDHAIGIDEAREDVQRASAVTASDHFGFALTGQDTLSEAGVALAVRFSLHSTLAGRDFEPLQVDVTIAAPQPWDAQPATREGLLAPLGLPPVHVLLIPVERQVAEKLHAATRLYKSGGTTRARDVIDLLLIQRHARVDGPRLGQEIRATFERRATHAVPATLPQLPAALAVSFRRDAPAVGLSPSLDEAHRLLAQWLDPLLLQLRGDVPQKPG